MDRTKIQDTQHKIKTAFATAAQPHNLALTNRELTQWGISHSAISDAFRRGDLIKLRHGVYAPPEFPTWNRESKVKAHHLATLKTLRTGALSHLSAALWWGCRLLELPQEIHVRVPRNSNHRKAGIRVHRTQIFDDTMVTLHHGFPVTTPLQTVLDCSKELPLKESLCVADYFLKNGLLSYEQAHAELTVRGMQGTLVARQMSIDADSPAETLARYLLYQWQAQMPREQYRLVTNTGYTYYVDFAWEHLKLVLEIDGEIKYSGAFGNPVEVIRAERKRQRDLERQGWVFIRVGWKEITTAPHVLKEELMKHGVRMGR